MAKSALNPDDIGEKGQSHFQMICADARLVCNKAIRDRTGWDFIVEFPFSDIQGPHSLDSRDAPLSSHVQVKTLLAQNVRLQNVRFKMRLSSAERLAKDIKPAFVYVAKVDWPNVIEPFLIHLIDDPLAAILKRLREENAVGNALVINKKFIYFSARPAGNAGQGVAYAARQAGVPCSIVVFETAPQSKIERMRALGAKVIAVPYDTAWKALDDRSLSRRRRYIRAMGPHSDLNLLPPGTKTHAAPREVLPHLKKRIPLKPPRFREAAPHERGNSSIAFHQGARNGSPVRSGLPAGGRRIRTIGPAKAAIAALAA
jgi:hypothetical protein